MTRGIIIITDAKQQETLYLPSDAFVGGIMNDVMSYCEANHGRSFGVKELAFDLLKTIAGLGVYSEKSNPGLDYVYTLKLDSGICPNDFTYQKVLPNCNYDEPIPQTLSEARFYRAEMEKKQREQEEYWTHQKELDDSILHCPHCGMKGNHSFSPKGEIVRCFIDTCAGRKAGKWCETFEEAIAAWNQYVLSARKV